jgi:deoxycytidylate deaminase
MLINARIARLVYREPYRIDPIALQFLQQAGVQVVQWQPEEAPQAQ